MVELSLEYIGQFSDPAIRRRLLRRFDEEEKLSELELILEEGGKKLVRLRRMVNSGKITLEQTPNNEDLPQLLSDVASDVNKFLQVENLDPPKVGYLNILDPHEYAKAMRNTFRGFLVSGAIAAGVYYFSDWTFISGMLATVPLAFVGVAVFERRKIDRTSHYSKSNGPSTVDYIIPQKLPEASMIPVLGHEYGHHALWNSTEFTPSSEFSFVSEAICRGIQRHIARCYQERMNNDAYTYRIQELTVGELKSTYIWLCEKLGVKPKKNLLAVASQRDKFESKNRRKNHEPTRHAIGHTLFYLEEKVQGPQIYANILKGDFKFASNSVLT